MAKIIIKRQNEDDPYPARKVFSALLLKFCTNSFHWPTLRLSGGEESWHDLAMKDITASSVGFPGRCINWAFILEICNTRNKNNSSIQKLYEEQYVPRASPAAAASPPLQWHQSAGRSEHENKSGSAVYIPHFIHWKNKYLHFLSPENVGLSCA
jgi:hypothetical protein